MKCSSHEQAWEVPAEVRSRNKHESRKEPCMHALQVSLSQGSTLWEVNEWFACVSMGLFWFFLFWGCRFVRKDLCFCKLLFKRQPEATL